MSLTDHPGVFDLDAFEAQNARLRELATAFWQEHERLWTGLSEMADGYPHTCTDDSGHAESCAVCLAASLLDGSTLRNEQKGSKSDA